MTSYTPTNLQSFYNHPDQYSTKDRSKGGSLETNFDKDDAIVNDIIEKIGLFIDVADVAALRALRDNSTYVTSTAQHVLRADQFRKVLSASDGTNTFFSVYWWNATSAVSDADGATGNVDTDGIVQPLAGYTAAGRWIRILQISTTGAGVFVSRQGIEALRTMLDYLYINMTNAAADVFLKLAKRTAGSVLKVTSDAKIQLKNAADSAFQDIDINTITASNQMIQTGTPTASAVLALFQQATAPVGASASGNYHSINAAAAYAGTYTVFQENGVTFLKILNSYVAAAKAMFQLGADFTGLSADGQMQVINAPAAFAGYLQAWLVNNTVKNIIYSDGRMKGTAASGSDEYVIKSQMEAAIIVSSVNSLWGDGSDGDVTISGTTTLTRDMYYNNLTIDVGGTLITAGYIVHVKNTATINGTLDTGTGAAGGAGTVGSGAPGALPGAAGGTAGTNTRGTLPVQNGVAGGAGGKCTSYGVNNSDCNGLPGTAGLAATNVEYSGGGGLAGSAGGAGNGGSVGAGGAAGTHTRKQKCLNYGLIFALALLEGLFAHAGNGAGGGGSSAFQSFGGDIGAGGGGGGTGAAAQTQLFLARILIWGASSIMKGVGGAGGAGGAGEAADVNGASGGGGGGGDGGNGALAMHLYNSKTGSPNTTNLAGGAAGAAGAGGSTSGGSSSPGAAGTVGTAGRTGVLVNVALAS